LIWVQVHELVHVSHVIGARVGRISGLTDHGAPQEQAKVFVEMSDENATGISKRYNGYIYILLLVGAHVAIGCHVHLQRGRP
jgi:hypothetical protein